MLKLVFQNAVAKDNGYGLEVNGKSLEDIISTALGTKVGDKIAGYGSSLPSFESNCCNITVIIEPQPVTEYVEDDDAQWDSVAEMEADFNELFQQKDAEAESEE